MKKILIVNNNLDMGGIQKSLLNLLKSQHHSYDITLLLFSQSGALLSQVPAGVKVISPNSCYKMLGLGREELKKFPLLFVFKAFLMKFASVFSRRKAMRILGLFQRKIKGYDTVISFSHLTNSNIFANGCGDFVLDKTECNNKVCLIHCDYLNSGFVSEQNNEEYDEFDKIACCSDSVKSRFIQGSGINPAKVYTLRNFFDNDIVRLSEENTEHYDDRYINIVSVARLSAEKGIDRAIEAISNIHREDIRYYVVGDGPQKKNLMDVVNECGLAEKVFFFGEQKNPYRYMAEADYLLVPSVHEAAPIVYDEARVLGVQVITTNTTSAEEMIGTDYGFVCNNSTQDIAKALNDIKKYYRDRDTSPTNEIQEKQLCKVLDGKGD